MKKIYYVSTRDVADGIVNEATVIKETEKPISQKSADTNAHSAKAI